MGEAHELFKEVIIFLVIYTFIITIIEKFNLLDWVYMGFEAKFAAKKENQNISPIAISKAIDDNESAHIDESITASNQDVGSNDSSTGQVEENKGDPLRALTTSVSFGRFMTEPLNWEKWCSFSHNQILEDVKKYSRPGAVAEKKAFFEAHYNNFAAKKAANSPQKENQVPNYPPPLPNTTANISPIAISKAIDDNESATLPHIDESMASSTASNQDVGSNLDFSNDSSTGQVEENKGDPFRALTTSVYWEKWSSFSHNRILEDVKKYSRPGAVAEKKAFFEAHYKNFAAKKAANSPQKENQVPNYPPPLPNTTANISPIAISKAYSSIDDTRENESATLVDVPHFDESMPSSTGVESEIASNEDVGSSGTNLDISEINIDDNISSTGQLEEEITLIENKRIHIKDAADMDKSSRLTKPDTTANISPIAISKAIDDTQENESATLVDIPHKATKVSENEVKKTYQVLPRPENKRSKPVIDCSTNGSRKVASKSLLTNHSEAPSACTKKPRPTTVPSTSSFKCDERASKRKQFFEKLEQRCKVNETQTIQLQPKLKDKTRSEKNRLRCSTAPEAQASTSETKAQSNNVQKVPPKTGRVPTPRLVQYICFRSPWKSSSKPKNFIEINKKKLISFMACLPAKKMQDSIG